MSVLVLSLPLPGDEKLDDGRSSTSSISRGTGMLSFAMERR